MADLVQSPVAAEADSKLVKAILDKTFRRLAADIEAAHGKLPEVMKTIK